MVHNSGWWLVMAHVSWFCKGYGLQHSEGVPESLRSPVLQVVRVVAVQGIDHLQLTVDYAPRTVFEETVLFHQPSGTFVCTVPGPLSFLGFGLRLT